jgi:xylulokinase
MGFAVGVDVGSQSVKGLLLDDSGRIRAEAGSPLSISHPAPAWAEQDPRTWESALATVIGRLLQDAGIRGDQVSVLTLACQVDGVVPVDASGDPVGPAIIWLDRRAEAQTIALRESVGAQRLREITGLVADPSHTGPKIAWIREERPTVFAAAAAFPPASGYLVQRLTGRLMIDHANASSSLLYDVGQRAWSDELLAAVGVSPAP